MPTELVRTNRRKVRWHFAVVFLAVFVAASRGLAQAPKIDHGGPRHRREEVGRRQRRAPHPKKDQHRHAPGFVKRLRDLPPEEQERVLANDERFQRLPTERQEMIRERLRRWNALNPEEKERLRERQEIFESLSPQQREEARALFQQWRRLEPERRKELMVAFRRLRDLPPGEREGFLSSPEIGKRFSPSERDLLFGLGRLLPASRGDASPEPED